MSFRFPISPSFSITGQPIARLISGDVPELWTKRTELFDAVLRKFANIHEGHEKARAIALSSQRSASTCFTLYLRNFGIEEYRYSDDPTERMYNLRLAQFRKEVKEWVIRAGSDLLSLRGGNDQLDELLGSGELVFTGQSRNWHSLAGELIQAAKAIIIFANDVSPVFLKKLISFNLYKKQIVPLFTCQKPPKNLMSCYIMKATQIHLHV